MTASAVPQRRPAPKTVTSFSRSWKEKKKRKLLKSLMNERKKVSEVSNQDCELCSFVRPKSTMASENKIGSAS